MSRKFRWRWAGSAAVAWLVPAVLSAILPAEARAGCNHPWVKGTGLSAPLVDLSLLDPSDRGAAPEPRSPKPEDRRGPCAGGACSQAPEPPPSSTAPVSSDGELWGDLPAESASAVSPMPESLARDPTVRTPLCRSPPSNARRDPHLLADPSHVRLTSRQAQATRPCGRQNCSHATTGQFALKTWRPCRCRRLWNANKSGPAQRVAVPLASNSQPDGTGGLPAHVHGQEGIARAVSRAIHSSFCFSFSMMWRQAGKPDLLTGRKGRS